MANITLDGIKAIIKSMLASATRYKPNLEVTDPDDPRYIAGKVPENKLPRIKAEKIQDLSTVAKSGSYDDLSNIPDIIDVLNDTAMISTDSSGNKYIMASIFGGTWPSSSRRRGINIHSRYSGINFIDLPERHTNSPITEPYFPGMLSIQAFKYNNYSACIGFYAQPDPETVYVEEIKPFIRFYTESSSSSEGQSISAVISAQAKKLSFIVGSDAVYVEDTTPNISFSNDNDTLGISFNNTNGYIEGLNEVILNSSTADSTKRFKITVDDSGTISATEVTT